MTVKFDDLNPLRSWNSDTRKWAEKFRDFRETDPSSLNILLNRKIPAKKNKVSKKKKA